MRPQQTVALVFICILGTGGSKATGSPVDTNSYVDINGAALKSDVEQVADIARKSEARGNHYWGRISGSEADHQTEEWIRNEFNKLRLDEVKIQPFALPPQWFPKSWNLAASAGDRVLKLDTAQPVLQSPDAEKEIACEAVYLGLGSKMDFTGRDVHGKAVILKSIPVGSILRHSAASNGAIERAAEAGAAAIVLIMDLPGNVRLQLESAGAAAPKVPTFSLGSEDGSQLLELMERSAVSLRVQLTVEHRTGLSTGSVWGVLPGLTHEQVLVIAHHDSYFEGADDNATGIATLLALARHFASLPQAARKRTIVFVATPAHHAGMSGVNWLRDNWDFSNTKLIINCEHTASTQTYVMPVIQKMNGPQAGALLKKSNVTAPRMWYVRGDPQLHDLIKNALRRFGVGIFDEPEAVALGELSAVYNKAPSFQLVEAPLFYHTELDRVDMVPSDGLEAVTRAYAAIIDGLN